MTDTADGGTFPSGSWPEEGPDQRTIAAMNTRRKAFRVTARTGFIVAPVMFLLPLLIPLLSGRYYFPAIICMTAAWAVLVSATSFQTMAHTKPGDQPWLHQLWAVPAAIIAMLPGGLAAFALYAAVV
ncbi:hypothetical protein [Curtobacterium sp. MCSS17_016]|uniref:hypothetical protein n=1 Tax=Curtobacterium sp. MCSS17_016 TaxID=2175644 RepID=UPI000DA8EFA2|nr:hypothetical protein [Curtobacterium sp. MCSS17_016]WIE81460.1 hypothetical protein DEJ19_019685 [Curtobacterium sp. MCSS17_016]